MTFEACIIIHEHQAKAPFDVGIMGDIHISGKFVSSNQIATENLDIPIFGRMAVKGSRSRSTINYRAKPVIQVGSDPGRITKALVSPLENNKILSRNTLPQLPPGSH
jgi:hypothetical protein